MHGDSPYDNPEILAEQARTREDTMASSEVFIGRAEHEVRAVKALTNAYVIAGLENYTRKKYYRMMQILWCLHGLDHAEPRPTFRQTRRIVKVCKELRHMYDMSCPGRDKAKEYQTKYGKMLSIVDDMLKQPLSTTWPQFFSPKQVDVITKCPDCGHEEAECITEYFGDVGLCGECDCPSGDPTELIRVEVRRT